MYGNLPEGTEKIRERRLHLLGHCVLYAREETSNLLLWDPQRSRSYLDNIKADTGLETIDKIRTAMNAGRPGRILSNQLRLEPSQGKVRLLPTIVPCWLVACLPS